MIRISSQQKAIIKKMAEIGPMNAAGVVAHIAGSELRAARNSLDRAARAGVLEELVGAPRTYRVSAMGWALVKEGRINLD